jgi:hypothetical protein
MVTSQLYQLQFDLTAHHTMQQLNTWNLEMSKNQFFAGTITRAYFFRLFSLFSLFTNYSFTEGFVILYSQGALGKLTSLGISYKFTPFGILIKYNKEMMARWNGILAVIWVLTIFIWLHI